MIGQEKMDTERQTWREVFMCWKDRSGGNTLLSCHRFQQDGNASLGGVRGFNVLRSCYSLLQNKKQLLVLL